MVAVEGSLNSYEWYQPGTIDDRAYVRALEALGRLVEKHARLTPDGGDDLLGQINAELRAASKGKVSISWGDRGAQRRITDPDEIEEIRQQQAGK
ncbi:hypothetical protein D3C73_1322320 [compost metagenome]